MPNISQQPQRQDDLVITDADLAALLAGTTDAVPGLRPVADVLAALAAEASCAELAGEARALAEFRRRAGVPVTPQRAGRPAGLTSRFGVKVGASVTAAVIVLGGGAAAAFADVLPAPIQRLAHEAIGAPIPPRQGLPQRGKSAAPGPPTVPGQYITHGRPAARGGPGAKRQAHPHPTPNPTAQGNPHAQGKQGNGSPGQGQGSGKGRHGSGQGQGSGKGHQGNGQGQGNGHGHQNNSQSQGNGHGQHGTQGNGHGQHGGARGNGPHGPARHANPHKAPHGTHMQAGGRQGTHAGPSAPGQS